jgi:hypothetical protein
MQIAVGWCARSFLAQDVPDLHYLDQLAVRLFMLSTHTLF